MGQRGQASVQFASHNVRGMNDDKLEMVVDRLREKTITAMCLYETWRVGDHQLDLHGCAFLLHGLATRSCHRGSQGVGIALDPTGREAWEKAGCVVKHFGSRVMAARLEFVDDRGRPLRVWLVAAYAPVGAAPRAERLAYLDDLQGAIAAAASDDVLLVGTDANASMGVRLGSTDKVRGPYGEKHVNDAGRDMSAFLGRQGLCLPTTFFRKNRYATWVHPCSRLGHQIDHWIMRRRDLKRVINAGLMTSAAVPSDHAPLGLILRVARRLRVRRQRVGGKVSLSMLRDPVVAEAFRAVVRRELGEGGRRERAVRADAQPQLTEVLEMAARETLQSDERDQPEWFERSAEALKPLIAERNARQAAYDAALMTARRRTTGHFAQMAGAQVVTQKRRLRVVASALKRSVHTAQEEWVRERMDTLNVGPTASPKVWWEELKRLKRGLSAATPMTPLALKNPTTGEPCTTPEENAGVFEKHFKSLYAKESSFDYDVLDGMEHREVQDWMDLPPTAEDVARHVARAKSGKAPGDNSIPVEYYKALIEEPDTLELLTSLIVDWWTSGETMPKIRATGAGVTAKTTAVPVAERPGKECIRQARREG